MITDYKTTSCVTFSSISLATSTICWVCSALIAASVLKIIFDNAKFHKKKYIQINLSKKTPWCSPGNEAIDVIEFQSEMLSSLKLKLPADVASIELSRSGCCSCRVWVDSSSSWSRSSRGKKMFTLNNSSFFVGSISQTYYRLFKVLKEIV